MVTSDFSAASRLALHRGLRVGGTFVNGTAVYFLHEPGLPDQEAHDRSFELRNGRRPNSYEKWALEVARQRHEVPA